ncbi:MAG: hypothetical protein ACFCGT_15370 [Sandaracinaceae bacterium]
MAERRLPTPLVLAVATAMIAVGVVAVVVGPDALSTPPEEDRRFVPATGFRIADSTPERAAETYYDAWRRRRWDAAGQVSVGEARRAVEAKRARDDALAPEERVVAARAWDALARAPLSLVLDRSEDLEDGALRLGGVAEYELVDRPYRREVSFEVVEADDAYRVRRMELGEVLTDLPPILREASAP